MIFVPSKDGISHNPTEYTSPEQWWVRSFRGTSWTEHSLYARHLSAIGAQVLLQAVLNYDARRTQ